MKNFLFIFLTIFSVFSRAQEDPYISTYRYYDKNEVVYLFGNNVHLRSEATSNSKSIAILPIGIKLLIQKKYEPNYNNSPQSLWIQVKFKEEVGYIRSDFLSLQTYELNQEQLYTQLLEENEEFYLLLRIKSKDNQAYKEYKYAIENPQLKINIYDNQGLQKLDYIIQIDYLSEACGVNGGGKYIFIHQGKWYDVFDYTQVSDAGIFYWEENLSFPIEHKKGNFILYTSESMETDENEVDYESPLNTEQHISKKVLRWDGEMLTPKLKQTPSPEIKW